MTSVCFLTNGLTFDLFGGRVQGQRKFMFKKLPNSTRKFIRSEKARIRRQFLDYKAQEELITNMYDKILNRPIVKKVEMPEPIKIKKTSLKKQEKDDNPSLPVPSRDGVRARKTKISKKKK